VSFALTVIFTRVYLEATGFPQLGNSVLHIAHALWGGLALFVAALLPLAFANRWALQASAILGGIGIGLFIDEIGKFITQTNDYFFAPALSLVYGFFLLCVLLYLLFRRPQQEDPRQAMYHALEGLQDALDGGLDADEAARIEAQLATAQRSDRQEVTSLAAALEGYLERAGGRLPVAVPGRWQRIATAVESFGRRLGRATHRTIISAMVLLWLALVIGYIIILLQGGPDLNPQVLQWRSVLVAIQAAVGCFMLGAALAWFGGREESGLRLAVAALLVSLVALQLHYFYTSQWSAIATTLLQFAILLILLAYRRWYLSA
jgi:hypothetical protein